ncbi:MAG: tetratricopeptide repeat protein [Thermoanaerobaculia bacterium]
MIRAARRSGLAAAVLLLCSLAAAADSEKLVAEARRAFEAGKFREAAAKYLQASNDPGLPPDRVADLSLQSAWACYIGGDVPGSRQALKKAFLTRPELQVLPEFYSDDFARLASQIKAEMPPPPKIDFEALKASARERLAGGLAQDVVYDLKRVSDSRDPEIHRLLAQAYEKLGKTAEADAEKKQAAALESGGISESTIGALPPPGAPAPTPAPPVVNVKDLLAAADQALAKGDFAAAADAAHKAQDGDPRSAPAHRIAGAAALGQGDAATAEREFLAANALDPADPKTQIGLARIAEKANQPNTAAAHFRRALELDPRSLPAATGLGEALLLLGDKSGARLAFGQAAEIDPTNAAARDRYGVFLATEGEFGPAIDQAIEAVKLDGNVAVYHAHLGLDYLRSKMLKESERELREAVRLDGKDAVSWNALGTVCLARNDGAAAAEAFSHAIEISGDDEIAITGKAAALSSASNWTEAAELLRKSQSEHPQSPLLAHDLGVAEYEMGRFGESARAFETEVRLSPASEEAKAALAKARAARDFEASAVPTGSPAP